MTGKLRWKNRVDDDPSAVITGSPTLVGMMLFVPVSSYEELAGANPHYSCCTFRGSIVALDASTGKLLWKSYTIAQKPHPGVTNAMDVQQMGPSGAAVWSSPTYDAAKGLIYATTVNGVPARGGSIDGPGAVIVGGILYATSGSGIWGGKPGNVLLAYSVDGR